MFSSSDLALWLYSGDLEANAGALVDLVMSGDVKIVTVLDQFTVIRGHYEPEIRFGRPDFVPTMAPTFR